MILFTMAVVVAGTWSIGGDDARPEIKPVVKPTIKATSIDDILQSNAILLRELSEKPSSVGYEEKEQLAARIRGNLRTSAKVLKTSQQATECVECQRQVTARQHAAVLAETVKTQQPIMQPQPGYYYQSMDAGCSGSAMGAGCSGSAVRQQQRYRIFYRRR